MGKSSPRSKKERQMGKRILIVDDATFIRMIVKNILVPKGYEIAGEAANGKEAVKKYYELRPDLVTMDITMNEKDGLEAAREILEMDEDARIIMVTALGQERMLVDSFKIGVKDFVVKPFKPERLLTAVQKALA
jgi:two-component system chemotaxis response regulator CheY